VVPGNTVGGVQPCANEFCNTCVLKMGKKRRDQKNLGGVGFRVEGDIHIEYGFLKKKKEEGTPQVGGHRRGKRKLQIRPWVNGVRYNRTIV